MRNYLIFITAAFYAATGFCQIVNPANNTSRYEVTNNADLQVIRVISSAEKDIKGSYYLDKDFTAGTILFHNTRQKLSYPMRYNALSNEIEAKRANDIVALKPVGGTEVFIENKSFVAIKNPKNNKNSYVEQLVSGQYKLFNLFEVKINKAASDATLLNIDDSDSYAIKDDLYYQIEGPPVKKLPKKKKELMEIFEAQKNYIEQNKLNLRKVDDLVLLFQHMNN